MPLAADALEQAADLLIDARRRGLVLDALPEAVRPATLAEGYAIQDRVRQRWGERVVGWKIGATAKLVQEKFGVDEPFAGPFFAATTFASPAATPAAAYHHRAIECEFAFRFGKALPARIAPYSRADIHRAIDAVIPAIEIVGPRFKDLLFGRAPTAVADCAINAGFVLGAACADWQAIDFKAHAVRLSVNGSVVAEGTGAAVLGDPFHVLDWAVNHLSRRGITLEAGQIISTGTTTGIVVLASGERACADFGSLGVVELTLTA